jgi:hypothetical protein
MTLSGEERAALVERYRDGAAHFEATVAGVTADELDAHPIDGEWSVREIAHHLADGELSSAVRLRRLIAEDEPVLPDYDEMAFSRRLHYGARPIATSIAAAAAARASTLTILEQLTDAEWARTGTHTVHGPYGVEAWLLDYANHPWDHADQVRTLLDALRQAAG